MPEGARVVRIFVRRSRDISYLVDDRALELEGAREGAALWWPLGERGVTSATDVLSRREGAVVGYDIVLAAPRPTSCLLAVGTPEEQRAVIGAHRGAVTGALAYLEDRAVVERRVVLGDVDELPRRLRAAVGFTHGVNRAGEPHLHDHVLVGAVPATSSRPLDGRSLFDHSRAADALYRAALRDGLSRVTERTAWRTFRGNEFVSGVDEGVRALWPGRASDREPKHQWSRKDIESRWRDDLRSYEPGPQITPPSRGRDQLNEHAFGAALEGPSLIRRQEVVAAWADAATFGATDRDVERAVSRWYGELSRERGRGTLTLSRARARMDGVVREEGPRLIRDEAIHEKSRERSSGRARESARWERNR